MIIYMLFINFISNQSGLYLFKRLLITHANLWYNSVNIMQKNRERKNM